MLVVVYHTGLGIVPGGYIGVDVFFVISGYLIAGMLSREVNTTGTISLVSFYARRARRLIPAAAVVITAVTIAANSLYSPLEFKLFSSSAIASLTYLSNFWFAHLATDYLAASHESNLLLHTWSLSVEEQFYIIWPFTLLAFHKLGQTRFCSQNAIVPILSISALSLMLSIWLTNYAQPWAFFTCFTRMWEFGLGAMVASLAPTLKKNKDDLLTTAGISLGIALILVPAFVFSEHTKFPGYAAIAPVIGTCLVIYFVDPIKTRFIYAAFSNRFARFIGDISYSFYLWHWPVFVFLKELGLFSSTLQKIAGILASLLLATVTYYCVENPFRFAKFSAATNFRSYTVGTLLILIALGLTGFYREQSRIGIDTPEQQRYAVVRSTRPVIYKDKCHHDQLEVELKNCEYGSLSAKDSVVLLGDSHAAHWFPALNQIAQENALRLLPFTKSSCPSADIEPRNDNLGRAYTECTKWRAKAFETIIALKPKYIVISNFSNYANGDDWERAQLRSFKALLESGAKIIMIADVPRLSFDAPTCLSRASWHNKPVSTACPLSLSEGVNQEISAAETRISSASPNISRVDLTDLICDKQPCVIERNGIVLYSDSDHLSVNFVKSLTSDFARILELE